jgi:hypothetical protein
MWQDQENVSVLLKSHGTLRLKLTLSFKFCTAGWSPQTFLVAWTLESLNPRIAKVRAQNVLKKPKSHGTLRLKLTLSFKFYTSGWTSETFLGQTSPSRFCRWSPPKWFEKTQIPWNFKT